MRAHLVLRQDCDKKSNYAPHDAPFAPLRDGLAALLWEAATDAWLAPGGVRFSPNVPSAFAVTVPTVTDERDCEPAEPGESESEPGLSDVELSMLAFERKWWKYAGAKESAVREQFDMSMTRYYQVLNALIDRPAGQSADPMTVSRLRRLRDLRRRRRSAEAFLDDGSA